MTRAGRRRRRRQRELQQAAQAAVPHKFGQFHIPRGVRVTKFDISAHDAHTPD